MKSYIAIAAAAVIFTACEGGSRATATGSVEKGADGNPVKVAAAVDIRATKLDKLARIDFNRRAAELNLPIFWRGDANNDNALNPDELATLWGVAETTKAAWADGSSFTKKMEDAYQAMTSKDDWSKLSPDEQKRIGTVVDELAQGRPTLVETDLTKASPEDRAVVDNLVAAARVIEQVYAKQQGVAGVTAADPPSKQLIYRNQSPFCEAPKTEKIAECSAVAPKPKKASGLYPANIQSDFPGFCKALEKRKDAKELLHQFFVVRAKAGGKSDGNPATDDLEAVPYHVEYQAESAAISEKIKAASAAIADPKEAAFKAYLDAAAASFTSGDWQPADEAWAKMSATNSKWYLRIAPDETYFEPCSTKAGFHMSFAKINPESLEWQKKLEPVKTDMEKALAELAGPPYQAHDVTFHLPDFIEVILNAGDARSALGATIGQSLPNWGPVANEGRGRTVAMVNFYNDADSENARKDVVSSLWCKETFDKGGNIDNKLGVMTTVLHEAAHNLGPSHEYAVKGKKDNEIFGGSLASMLEELKAETAASFFGDWLAEKNIITQAQADGAHYYEIAWALGHISQGMVDGDGKPKAYSQLASIQMGSLMKAGALSWMAEATAANGKDKGCFQLDMAKWRPAMLELGKAVLHVKGAGDKAMAEKLKKEFVDDPGAWADHRKTIADRWLRQPKASFVYAINE